MLVFLGGGIGSVVRYMSGRLLTAVLGPMAFPGAILLVNLVASLVLGMVVGGVLTRTVSEEWRLLLGVGFCGGLSTFSSFSQDTLLLLQGGNTGLALLNIGLNVVGCLLASSAGFWLSQP